MIKQWGKKIEQQYHFLEFNDAMKPDYFYFKGTCNN